MALPAWLSSPLFLNYAARALAYAAIVIGPRVVDFNDAISVWRFKRRRELRRTAAALRRGARKR